MIQFLTSNAVAIFFMVFIAVIFLSRSKKRKDELLKAQRQQDVKQQASAAGFRWLHRRMDACQIRVKFMVTPTTTAQQGKLTGH